MGEWGETHDWSARCCRRSRVEGRRGGKVLGEKGKRKTGKRLIDKGPTGWRRWHDRVDASRVRRATNPFPLDSLDEKKFGQAESCRRSGFHLRARLARVACPSHGLFAPQSTSFPLLLILRRSSNLDTLRPFAEAHGHPLEHSGLCSRSRKMGSSRAQQGHCNPWPVVSGADATCFKGGHRRV